MRKGTLIRGPSGDSGTFGDITLDDGFTCKTGELPWRNNASGRSCIPAGTYIARPYNSDAHGACYLLEKVPYRTDVEIHSANWMGDRDMGYKCELLGCIALGISIGWLDGQKALTSSRAALNAFMSHLAGDDLELTIIDAAP